VKRAAWCLALALGATSAHAQSGSEGGIGPAPREARAIIARAVRAMGGKEALLELRTAVMSVDPSEKARIQERHSLKLKGRWMHYASRRRSGAGFDVILARGQTFLCDRDPKGNATYVEDLTPRDAKEGSYERDILFMPLLLVLLLEKNARMDYRGKNSVGDVVIRAQVRPPDKSGQPFVIRLRFDKTTHLLTAAMGTVPWGTDKGKKRYCFYSDYRAVGPKGIKLPHELKDQRGKSARARTFTVTWELDKALPPEMFLRPNVEKKD
jgi:hypothetical protein